MSRSTRRIAACAASSLLCLSLPADATNGLNLIGFGTESVSMGGADLAIARDTSALNTNPAGLAQIRERRLDLNSLAVFALNVRHRDGLGNDSEIANDRVFGGGFGYAQRLDGRPVTLGVGLFAQGGAGFEYPAINTAFGTQDEMSSIIRIAKLSGGAAADLNDRLSVGFSVAATYSDINQRVFPNTSFYSGDPATSFFGFRLEDMTALGIGYKLGLRYRPDASQTWGVTYTGPTSLDMRDGTFVSNQSALGLGNVTYRDVRIDGMKTPQELGVAYAQQATPKLLWTAELSWIDWSTAMDTSTLTASNPDNPAAVPGITATSVDRWRDQYVIALGLEYKNDVGTTYRAGYNYGRNPIPNENLNPLKATTAEHHLTLGLGLRIGRLWHFDAGLEYLLPNKVTYTNPSLPFGANAQAEGEALALYSTLSRIW